MPTANAEFAMETNESCPSSLVRRRLFDILKRNKEPPNGNCEDALATV